MSSSEQNFRRQNQGALCTTARQRGDGGSSCASTTTKTSAYTSRYLPAVLRKNATGWLVEYYVRNPDIDQMERRRLKLNKLRKRYRTIAEFKVAANDIVATVNAKLADGWTPFGESENTRYYTPIADVLHKYIEERSKELKKETMRSYSSFANIFGTWLNNKVSGCKCIYFNRTLAITYLDDFYATHSNARTYNNMLKMARAFFGWAKEKCYIKENPFELIRTKKTAEKKRILIPKPSRQQICAYFAEQRPEMVIVCGLVYTSLIRPIEITRLQVGMLHLQEHYIAMPSDITKNGHNRNAPLSDDLCERLREHIRYSKPTDYLFGSQWEPAPAAISDKAFRKQWQAMRNKLHIPNEMQLYSLRDTGIFDKIKAGVNPLTVMQAADHHDLAMTTRYANHYDPNMIHIISEADDF